MRLVLLISSVLLVLAIGWSFGLLRRLRDWRAGVVIAWLAATMLLLVLALGGQGRLDTLGIEFGPGELQQLAISSLAIAAVVYFHVVFQHDALTGLPNRALFAHRLARALARVRRESDRACAVLFLDLDRFKVVNESLGHAAGDQLLLAVGKRLQSCLRRGDVIARLGGDEFVVLLQNEDERGATRVAQRLHGVLARPIVLNGQEVFTTASIGISVTTSGREGGDTLLREADLAMYGAKMRGKSRHEVFKLSMQVDAMSRLRLESDLRRATRRGEFLLYYQPIVSLREDRLVGLEALLRWRHPERGIVRPDLFIPIAEETGLIVPIGFWVLEEACQQMRRWQDAHPALHDVLIQVNLSARQFLQADLVDQVADVLERTGLPARCLALEMTETVMMSDVALAGEILACLCALGVNLQIDDFGTGYSSLSYLHRFPIQRLKIDRSFVTGMTTNEENATIVRSINHLARELHLEVIAEGVETADELGMLRTLDCGFAQGNYFCEARDLGEIDRLIAQGRWATNDDARDRWDAGVARRAAVK